MVEAALAQSCRVGGDRHKYGWRASIELELHRAHGCREQRAEWIGKLFHLPHPINFAAARIRFDGVLSDADIAALEAARAAAIATNAPIVASGNAKGAYNAKPFNTLRYGASLLQFVPSPATDSVGVVFNIFDDNGLKYSKTILNEEPFRLPSGFKIRRMRVGTVSQACVKSIELAESMAGLNVA